MLRKFQAVSIIPFVLILLGSAAVQAESSCKGVEKDACQNNASCRWIGSYKRSDGRAINGYCRMLPKGKAKAEQSKVSSSAD